MKRKKVNRDDVKLLEDHAVLISGLIQAELPHGDPIDEAEVTARIIDIFSSREKTDVIEMMIHCFRIACGSAKFLVERLPKSTSQKEEMI